MTEDASRECEALGLDCYCSAVVLTNRAISDARLEVLRGVRQQSIGIVLGPGIRRQRSRHEMITGRRGRVFAANAMNV